MAVTENLGLQVFSSDGSDSFLSFWQALAGEGQNSNMEIIDAAVKALNDALTELAGDIPAETPVATTETAGKVKPDGVTITIDPDGTIRSAVTVNLATTENAGIVKPDGITITVDANGTIRATCEIATLVKAGIVKPDGTTITVDANGVISARDSYTKAEVDALLTATSELLISASDLEDLGDGLDTLMGESNTYTSLGAGIVAIDSLATQIIS